MANMAKVAKSLNNSQKAANTKHEKELDVKKKERIRGGYFKR